MDQVDVMAIELTVEERLAARGLRLPQPARPAGSYQRVVIAHGIGAVSAQFPIVDGRLAYTGRLGEALNDLHGYEAAQLAGLNVLAQIGAALDGFEALSTLLRVDGYVAVAPGFDRLPKVLDGTSDLFHEVLGERGTHARSAIPVPRLPLDAPVELVVSFAVQDASATPRVLR